MNEDQILTLHPQGLPGTVISLSVYELVKEAIVEVFLTHSAATLEEISKMVMDKLRDKTDTDIPSLLPVVCLDLEARNFIERLSDTNPAQFQLKFFIC